MRLAAIRAVLCGLALLAMGSGAMARGVDGAAGVAPAVFHVAAPGVAGLDEGAGGWRVVLASDDSATPNAPDANGDGSGNAGGMTTTTGPDGTVTTHSWSYDLNPNQSDRVLKTLAAFFGISVLGFFIVVFLLYFIPIIIAVVRHSTMTLLVVVLNLLFGWTVLGWFGALIIALVSPTREQRMMQRAQAASLRGPGDGGYR